MVYNITQYTRHTCALPCIVIKTVSVQSLDFLCNLEMTPSVKVYKSTHFFFFCIFQLSSISVWFWSLLQLQCPSHRKGWLPASPCVLPIHCGCSPMSELFRPSSPLLVIVVPRTERDIEDTFGRRWWQLLWLLQMLENETLCTVVSVHMKYCETDTGDWLEHQKGRNRLSQFWWCFD